MWLTDQVFKSKSNNSCAQIIKLPTMIQEFIFCHLLFILFPADSVSTNLTKQALEMHDLQMELSAHNMQQSFDQEFQSYIKSRSLIPASTTPSLQINAILTPELEMPPETLSLISNVSAPEIREIISEYTSASRKEGNCLVARKYLDILPSNDSLYSSIWHIFDFFGDPHQEMKSYRTMAYDILASVEHAESGASREIRRAILELRYLKQQYFELYYASNPKDQESKRKKRKSMCEEMEANKEQIKLLRQEISELNKFVFKRYEFLEQVVQFDSLSGNEIKGLLQKTEELRNLIGLYQSVSSFEELENISHDLRGFEIYVSMKEYLRILKEYDDLLEPLLFMLDNGIENEDDKVSLKEQIQELKNTKKQIRKIIEKKKRKIVDILEEELKTVESQLDNHKYYKMYNTEIDNVVENMTEINQKKEEILALQLENESKVIDMNSCYIKNYSDYVLPPNSLFDTRLKLEKLKLLLKRLTPKKPQEPRKKTERTPQPNFGIFDLTPKPEFEVFDLPHKPLAKFNVFDVGESYSSKFKKKHPEFRASLREAVEYSKSIASNILYSVLNLEKQLFLMAKIEDREKALDEHLGRTFAEIYELEGGFRCFSLPQISYFFFNMFKTNVVVNQHRFLFVFLSHLGFSRVKEFALYNLSLFSNKEYIADFEKKLNRKDLPPKQKLEQEKEFISQFAVNFVSVIDVYKDMTEYRDPGKLLSKGTLFMNVLRSVKGDLGRLLLDDLPRELTQSTVFLYVHALVQMIPFFRSVPFLDKLLGFLVTKLVIFVSKKLSKVFSALARPIVKKFNRLLKGLRTAHYDLDFDRVISDALDATPEPPSVTLSFDNLDDIYKGAYKKQASLFQTSLENSRLFVPERTNFDQKRLALDIEYFNEYIMGSLILKRMFKSAFPVHIVEDNVNIDLTRVSDYDTKLKLFEEVYKLICTDEDWKEKYFDEYNEEQNVGLARVGSFDEDYQSFLHKKNIAEIFGDFIMI